jgi:hypothetical protein
MNAFVGPLLGFVVFGGYLLVWPIYRILHPGRTQRRQALLDLFMVEVGLHVPLMGVVVFCFVKHYSVLPFGMVYLLLAAFCWVATYGVWADNGSEPDT